MAGPPECDRPPDDDRAAAFDAAPCELSGLLERGAIMRAAAALVAEHVGLDVAWIAEPRDDDRLEIRYLHRAHADVLRGLVVPRGLGLGGRVFELGHIEAVDEYFASRRITRHFDAEVAAEEIRRMIAAPIAAGDRTLGVIWGACCHPGSFGGVAEQALRQAARRAATALEAADRARHLTHTAVHEHRREPAVRLHDSLGASPFASRAGVRALSDALVEEPELRACAETIEVQATTAAALRDSLQALSAPPREMGLEVALRADCRAFEDRTGLPASFVLLAAEIPDPGAARAEALVGAGREALLNVEEHARANGGRDHARVRRRPGAAVGDRRRRRGLERVGAGCRRGRARPPRGARTARAPRRRHDARVPGRGRIRAARVAFTVNPQPRILSERRYFQAVGGELRSGAGRKERP